jgi:uroporphyrinogen-III decarboxylase
MAKNLTGYPENWPTLTPEQKREWRLNRFLNGEGIKFVSPEAQKAYKIRARRYVDVYNIQEPDRVPVNLPIGDLPYLLNGVNCYTQMYDVQKAIDACIKFNAQYSNELELWASPASIPGNILEAMDYHLYAWPGHGLSREAPGYQFVEGEYMKADEYEDLIKDPSDFWVRTYLPRVFGILEGFKKFRPATDLIEIPMGQLNPLADPQVRAMFRKLADVGDDMAKRFAQVAPYMGLGSANGYPVTFGAFGFAPFDIMGDTLRGTTSIMKDMYRRPDEVLKAIDVITDINIKSILNAPSTPYIYQVVFPLHKGADGWMSPKQFEKFYLPSLKKFVDALNNEGLMCNLFAEGSYNTRLESVNVFRKGFVSWIFDQSDMAKAKQILGRNSCIIGNVPSSLIVTGNPGDVKAYCKKLIETCAPGGGYILAAGCTAENPKLDNLRAMLGAAKEYGVYRK